MATFVRDASPNLSLREKATLKRRVNKEHNSNFRAGYVHVNEEYLHKTGIRGRKRYCIYCVMAFMALVAAANVIITIIIVSRLKIDKDGMESMEFTPGGELLRFLGDSDMGEIYAHENTVYSLPYSNLELEGSNGNSVLLKSTPNANGSSVEVGKSGVKIMSRDGFHIISPETGKTIFTSDLSDYFSHPVNSSSLSTDEVLTSKVTSRIDEDLAVEGERMAVLKGNEGLQVQGKQVLLSADKAIQLTTQQHITIDGQDTYMFNPTDLDSMTVADGPVDANPAADAYTVCVCMPSGKLFLVPAQDTCNDANEDKNPCDDG